MIRKLWSLAFQASAPNITGSNATVGDHGRGTGAFLAERASYGFNPGGTYWYNLSIDASKSSSIYGRSNYLYPNFYSSMFYIKYK